MRFLATECERWDFPCGSDSKESSCYVGDLGSIPGLGRSPGEGILAWRIPWTEEPGRLQSMGSQSGTQLRDFHFHRMSKVAWNKPEKKAALPGKRKRKKAGSQKKQRQNMIKIFFSLVSFSFPSSPHSFLPNLVTPSLPSLLLSFHCS